MSIPPWLPIVISFTGMIVALSAFIWQVKRARFNQSIDLLFKLENDFFGTAKRLQRAKAANGMERGDFLEAEPILDFFETMALLLRRGALDTELVWHTFFYWVDHYYEASRNHIAQRQSFDPLVWKDLGYLVKQLRQMQTTRLGAQKYSAPTREQVSNFLEEEQT